MKRFLVILCLNFLLGGGAPTVSHGTIVNQVVTGNAFHFNQITGSATFTPKGRNPSHQAAGTMAPGGGLLGNLQQGLVPRGTMNNAKLQSEEDDETPSEEEINESAHERGALATTDGQSAHAEGAFDWDLATDHGGGWKSFDWFGPYWESNGTNWIYHHELGWLYRQGASIDSIWLWKSHFGWFWMHKDHPPYAYAHEWGNKEVHRELLGDEYIEEFQPLLEAAFPDSEPPWANPFTGWVYFDWAGELRSESILYREWNFHFYKDGAWNKDEVDGDVVKEVLMVGASYDQIFTMVSQNPSMGNDTLGLPLETTSEVLEQLRKAAEEEAIDWDDNETRDKIIAEAIDIIELEWRGEFPELVAYAPNQETPYTGWGKQMYDNGQVEWLGQYKNGKQDGLVTWWYMNGLVRWEAHYKDGKQDGLMREWYINRQRKMESTWKDGKMDGLMIAYNTDGTEQFRVTYRNGEQVLDVALIDTTQGSEFYLDSGDVPSGEDAPEADPEEDAPSEEELNEWDDERKAAVKGFGDANSTEASKLIALENAGILDLDDPDAKVEITLNDVKAAEEDLEALWARKDQWAAEEAAYDYEVIVPEADYYLTGPQQASPPDGSFKKGTRLALVRDSLSYSLVTSKSGITAYVSTEAIALLEDVAAALAMASKADQPDLKDLFWVCKSCGAYNDKVFEHESKVALISNPMLNQIEVFDISHLDAQIEKESTGDTVIEIDRGYGDTHLETRFTYEEDVCRECGAHRKQQPKQDSAKTPLKDFGIEPKEIDKSGFFDKYKEADAYPAVSTRELEVEKASLIE